MKLLKTLLMAFACFGLVLTGCSTTEEQEEVVELKTIGEKVEGENVYQVEIKNATGKDIVGFSIKTDTMDDYSEEKIIEDKQVAAEQAQENIESVPQVEQYQEQQPQVDYSQSAPVVQEPVQDSASSSNEGCLGDDVDTW